MKVIESKKSITSGMTHTVKQTIAAGKIAQATYLLRDKIYSDKLKATLFETVCNAVDEHRKYNVARPVDIILTKSELCIRDYAKGLSIDDVEKIFFQYFESTKSGNNNGIGGFGIGAKAPSSYADVYYVISYHDGKKHMFVSSINGYEAEASLVYSTDNEPSDTGICVRIPINVNRRYEDNLSFRYLCQDLYRQIGFNSDKDEINVYIVDSEMEYDEFITKNDEFKINAKNAFNSDNVKSMRNLRIEENKYLVGDIGIVYKNNSYYGGRSSYAPYMFNSNFFKNKRFMAYDGDMCYQFDIPEDFMKNLELDVYNYRYIFFFKRGELAILPTREAIEINELSLAWVKNKIKKMSDFFMEKSESKFNSEMLTCNPAYKIKNNIQDSISEYISFSKVLNWTKYTMQDDVLNMTFKCNTFKYSAGNYKNEIVSIKSRDYAPAIVNGDKHIIFIINDKKPDFPRAEILNAFRAYYINKYSEDDFDKNFVNTVVTFVVLWEPNTLSAFDTYKKNFKFRDTEVLRKDVDYFEYSDLKATSTFTRSRVGKKASKTVKIYDYYATSTEIPEDEYEDTLIIAPSDITNNVNGVKDIIDEINRRGYTTYLSFCKFVGLKHFTKCYKNSFDKFKEAGCKSLVDFDFKKNFIDFIKKSGCITSTRLYNIIANSIGEPIENTYKDKFDFYDNYCFMGNNFIGSGERYTLNSFANMLLKNEIDRRTGFINKEIENELLKYSNEELIELRILFEPSNYLYCNSLTDNSNALYTKYNSLIKKQKEIIAKKYHDKLSATLKKVKITF